MKKCPRDAWWVRTCPGGVSHLSLRISRRVANVACGGAKLGTLYVHVPIRMTVLSNEHVTRHRQRDSYSTVVCVCVVKMLSNENAPRGRRGCYSAVVCVL